MANFCWQPLADVNIDILAEIVGKDKLKRIEQENLGKNVLHCFRVSSRYKFNRHKHSNYA